MTDTQSLSERLREPPARYLVHSEDEAFILNERLRQEAADALDARTS